MSEVVDSAVEVRAGEELNQATLEPFLRDQLRLQDGEFKLTQFPGGHSNLTYLIKIGETEMVLRRPPFGSTVKSAHDMNREYTILSKLNPVYSPAPRPLLFCDDQEVIGCDFYVMERLKGMILRGTRPDGYEPSKSLVTSTCVAMAHNLGDLHRVDWSSIGLEALQKKEGSFMQRQVDGWTKRYAGSKTHDLPLIDQVLSWCNERIPEDSGAVLIHNDYKFDNVVLNSEDSSQIIGVLDWEMSTIGDPLFDLGVALGYWVNPDEPEGISTTQSFIYKEPGSISRQQFAEKYGERTGYDVSNMNYYYVFAMIKLAVVLQQIYYRYHHGLTSDERFSGLINGVKLLAERSAVFIDRGDF
jgi:aminoglycoside phosphotransferase (APT) family kinase protein